MSTYISLFSGGLMRVAFGTDSVTGSKTIATGLETVYACFASLDDNIDLNAAWVQAEISATAGSIDVKVWKPTSATDVTPIAATAAKTVSFLAIGK